MNSAPTAGVRIPADNTTPAFAVGAFMRAARTTNGHWIVSTRRGGLLGSIEFDRRAWNFSPAIRAVFSAECLRDLSAFMDRLDPPSPLAPEVTR